MTRPMHDPEHGATLVELMVGLTLFAVIASSTVALMRQQGLAFTLGAGRMDALQTYRFAAETLERNLRTAGTNLASGQPFLVYADSATVAINADYASSDPGDVFAVYIDRGASGLETGGLTRARRLVLPRTSFAYPDSTYRTGAVTSAAETIIFFFAPDTTSTRADDHVLFRQVNDRPAEAIARGLVRLPGEPFFAYQELITGDTITPRTEWIGGDALPLRHSVTMHLSAVDTGSVARIDRVRAVRVAFGAVSGQGQGEQMAPLRRLIRMPNAGQASLRSCGEDPLFNSAVASGQPAGELRVVTTWGASFDELSGEGDIVRYAIFRRVLPSSDWGEPYFSMPAGQPNYEFSDDAVVPDSTYQYGIAAQDCTPSMSGMRLSPTVLVEPI